MGIIGEVMEVDHDGVCSSPDQPAEIIHVRMMPVLVDLDSQAGSGTFVDLGSGGASTSQAFFMTEANDSASSPISGFVHQSLALSEPTCAGCGHMITDRYLLKVTDDYWHEGCLQCAYCGNQLSQQTSCYVRDCKVFCRTDYHRIYGFKCTRCFSSIGPEDLVFRCGLDGPIFHVGCFTCIFCGLNLQKGDQYVCYDGQIVCRRDYDLLVQNSYGDSNCKYSSSSSNGDNRKTPKRPRTILTSSQRKAFKESFEHSAKPCRKVREALAKETGLSVRVVQVWFQNQRAKMKKIRRSSKDGSDKSVNGGGDGDGGSTKDDDDGCSSDDDMIKDDHIIDDSRDSQDAVTLDPTNAKDPCQRDHDNQLAVDTTGVCSEDSRGSVGQTTPIDRLFSMQSAYFNF